MSALPAAEFGERSNPKKDVTMTTVLQIGNLATGYDYENLPNSRETIVIQSGSNHPIMHSLDEHRAGFVREKEWMGPDHLTDIDRYDDPSMWTQSFVDIMKNEGGEDKIVSSLRFTRVENAKSCMSFDMVDLDFNEELSEDQQFHLNEAAENKTLYDLTRLLPSNDDTISQREYLASVLKLFGFGVYHTAVAPQQDPTWVCATEPGFRMLLLRLGVTSEVLKEARRDVPRCDQAVLYKIKPKDALIYAHSQSDKFAFGLENVTSGINEARLTPIR